MEDDIEMEDDTQYMEVLIDDCWGIYIPQRFAEIMNRAYIKNVSDRDWLDLLEGPENDNYWDTWDRVLNNAVLKSRFGNEDYNLWQDGDLYIYIPATVH